MTVGLLSTVWRPRCSGKADFFVPDNVAPQNRHDHDRRWTTRSKNEDDENKCPPQCRVDHNSSPSWRNPAAYLCHQMIELVISNDHLAKKCANTSLSSSSPCSIRTDGVFWGNYGPAFVHFLRPWPQSSGLLSGRGFGRWMGVFFSGCGACVFKVIYRDKLKLTKLRHRTSTLRQTDGMVRAWTLLRQRIAQEPFLKDLAENPKVYVTLW